MKVNWRLITAAQNSFAALSAACEKDGYLLRPADRPAHDVTCYSLNSINADRYREEIATANCITIVGGPHATACPHETAEYADFVVVGEGEFTLPRLLAEIEDGNDGKIPGVATRASVRTGRYLCQARRLPGILAATGICRDQPGLPVFLQLLSDAEHLRALYAAPFC